MVMLDEKAQLHTLEGVAAATLILLVIIYAIDATSMTPLTSSTSNAHVQSELVALGQDILNTLDYEEPGYNSKLKNDILNWDGNQYIWNGYDYILDGGTNYLNNSNLSSILKKTLISQGIAHKVEIVYLINSSNNIITSAPDKMIDAGIPSNNAVIVSRKIVLQDTDCTGGGCNSGKYLDIDPSTNLYNIVDIKLILWRT